MSLGSAVSRSTKPKPVKSRLRKWGWPLIVGGFAFGLLGAVVLIGQANSYGGSTDGAIAGPLLLAFGVGTGNVGFFVLLFGILEERVYEAQAMVREVKERLSVSEGKD